MAAGLISVAATPAPSVCSSMRRASVKPLIACLLAQYIPWSGQATFDATLPRLINTPRDAFRCGSAASEPWTTPQKLV